MGSTAYATEIFESRDRITDGLPQSYGFDHYVRYFLAGGICASFSHGVAIPFDVVKTRLQTGISTEFVSSNVLVVAQSIVDKEGVGMLFKGTGPTLIGYLIQGSLKYGFYEVFKPIVKAQMALSGIGVVDSEIGNKILGFMIAGACAEFIGSSFLAPFEAARIRLVANPSFAPGIVGCLNRMVEEETAISLFLGLPAILSKMIPYTVVQLSTYEFLTSTAYGYLASSGVDISTMGAPRYVLSAICALAAGDIPLLLRHAITLTHSHYLSDTVCTNTLCLRQYFNHTVG
jgi:solute carrier family 25 phosphate transporter 3